MKIWVDADACPVVIREILFRAADRSRTALTLVANQQIRIPPSPHIHFVQVTSGFDVADHEIVRRAGQGDLVITSDIPLVAQVIANGALALSPRGELLTTETIGARLNVRDFLDTLRGSGIHGDGPRALGAGERRAFANQLDRLLAQARSAGR